MPGIVSSLGAPRDPCKCGGHGRAPDVVEQGMTIDELFQHLIAQGYGHLARRTPHGIDVLDFALQAFGDGFRVCDTERGQILQIWLETKDEAQACSWYLDRLAGLWLHLTTSPDEIVILRQQGALEAAGISVRRNDIPNFNAPGDARYRIFVGGSDLKRAKTVLNLLQD